ncbi:MAG TPA: DUF998 domain-containing protein [Candidatus Dojkabacteria bacterium]|mgnify:CR=1 FL=1|nr:DUF998 domain-containing protein [Candidatus Dojkabacteria bacterium]HQF36354.1 DUF998 domain-containing protein [Candidatus Dojkabacteria bacterium]
MFSTLLIKFGRLFRASGFVALIIGLGGSAFAYSRHPSLDRYWPAISNLGAYLSSAFWFNSTLIVTGLFLLIFWLGYSEHKKYTKFEQLLCTLPSFGVVGLGIFPANYGNCMFCLQRIIHWSFAIIFLVGLIISTLIVSSRRLKYKRYKVIFSASLSYLLFGIIVFIGTFTPIYGVVAFELYLLFYAISVVVFQLVDWILSDSGLRELIKR